MLFGQRLLDYLAYAIHGARAERKPPARAQRAAPRLKLQPTGPARDERYKAWIRTFPCLACGAARAVEAAHTGDDGGMALKASDSSCVPLCAGCHRLGPDAYHRIGRKAFAKRHKLNFARARKALTEAYRRASSSSPSWTRRRTGT